MIWIASCVNNFLLQNLLICFHKQTGCFATVHISLDRFPKTEINQDVLCHVEVATLLTRSEATQ